MDNGPRPPEHRFADPWIQPWRAVPLHEPQSAVLIYLRQRLRQRGDMPTTTDAVAEAWCRTKLIRESSQLGTGVTGSTFLWLITKQPIAEVPENPAVRRAGRRVGRLQEYPGGTDSRSSNGNG